MTGGETNESEEFPVSAGCANTGWAESALRGPPWAESVLRGPPLCVFYAQ